jgi:predicted nucleotidyltransferase
MAGDYGQARDALIRNLVAEAERDQRILAVWLQGSLADGTGDEYSDIDAYLAVADESFDAVAGERSRIAESLGRVLVEMDSPWLRAGHYLFDGLLKLDLFLEPASTVDSRERAAVRVLFDRGGVAPRLRIGSTGRLEEVRRRVEVALLGTLQGAAWPVRLLGRDQWTTLAFAELFVINDSIALLMAAQLDPSYVLRNRFSLPRLLWADQASELDRLASGVMTAIDARDRTGTIEAQLEIVDALFLEGRRACETLEIVYPLDRQREQAIRQSYLRFKAGR